MIKLFSPVRIAFVIGVVGYVHLKVNTSLGDEWSAIIAAPLTALLLAAAVKLEDPKFDLVWNSWMFSPAVAVIAYNVSVLWTESMMVRSVAACMPFIFFVVMLVRRSS